MCETCAHYEAECERLRERCETLHARLHALRVNRLGGRALCLECLHGWMDTRPESHAPGCLCAPEAGPSFDAPVFDPPLQPAGNPLRPAPDEEKSR